jgi:hypothetical protein
MGMSNLNPRIDSAFERNSDSFTVRIPIGSRAVKGAGHALRFHASPAAQQTRKRDRGPDNPDNLSISDEYGNLHN